MVKARSILFRIAASTAVECSAALPITATTITPMNRSVMPRALGAAQAGGGAVERLVRVAKAAQQDGQAQDEQHVADDRAGDAGLDQVALAVVQGQEG